jgi:hypothetical protein
MSSSMGNFEKMEENSSINFRECIQQTKTRQVICKENNMKIHINDNEDVFKKIWSIGSRTGWYYADWFWEMRGFIDKIFGGVGLRRGRKNQNEIYPGDTLDFWRVLIADKRETRSLLFAEMKLPGEAWLEFRIDNNNVLHQTATFRPLGLWGRLYWYSVLPFHGFIFRGMIRNIAALSFNPGI